MEAPIPDSSIYNYPAFTPQGESLVWHFSFFAAGDRLAETLITGKERFFFEHFIKRLRSLAARGMRRAAQPSSGEIPRLEIKCMTPCSLTSMTT